MTFKPIGDAAKTVVNKLCTCDWSAVDTTTIDPPHIVWHDPNCPRHGWRSAKCPDDEGQFEAIARRRDARDGFDE